MLCVDLTAEGTVITGNRSKASALPEAVEATQDADVAEADADAASASAADDATDPM